MFKWLDASEAAGVGTALADDFVLQSASGRSGARKAGADARPEELKKFLQKFLQRVDREARPLNLNVFRRAKLANSFKWRLLEQGVEPNLADELTHALVLRLMGQSSSDAAAGQTQGLNVRHKPTAKSMHALHEKGSGQLKQGAYVQALATYEQLLRLDARDAFAHNGIGLALVRLNRYQEAEDHLRRAIGIRESLPDAHFNLAGVLLSNGRYREAEMPLRRALKLKPDFVDARVALAGNLVLIGRLAEARDNYAKALRSAPGNAVALVGLGKLEAVEGRFDQAELAFQRAVEVAPDASYAWAAIAGLRKMTPADGAWLKRAEEIAASPLPPLDEATLRFSIGKYYDDVGDYVRAFRAFQRANELHKLSAARYEGNAHARFVDDMVRVYTREALRQSAAGASNSERPVFVMGMPRSGTSLVEQIIASHPSAYGAGELEFWTSVVHKSETSVRERMPDEPTRTNLARDYLRLLGTRAAEASRVVDKAPINSDYLGLIHTVFPRARMIYLQRDPIDTCLSCFFQQFSQVMNFTMDLADLANYYREHQRVMAHWRAALPAGTLLDVPYEDLVADPEKWTRRILEFLGLPWDAHCLDFHETRRAVTTASSWQVRQRIYQSSVERWRNYEKFIKPLLSLRDLDA